MPSHATPSAGSGNFIFRDARQDVRDVMLDAMRQTCAVSRRASAPSANLRREIIRVQIGGDHFRLRVVKPRQIGGDAAERLIRLLRFQIADVLADENIFADRQRHGIFQMRADGEN